MDHIIPYERARRYVDFRPDTTKFMWEQEHTYTKTMTDAENKMTKETVTTTKEKKFN